LVDYLVDNCPANYRLKSDFVTVTSPFFFPHLKVI
jgi:hypothetical protein